METPFEVCVGGKPAMQIALQLADVDQAALRPPLDNAGDSDWVLATPEGESTYVPAVGTQRHHAAADPVTDVWRRVSRLRGTLKVGGVEILAGRCGESIGLHRPGRTRAGGGRQSRRPDSPCYPPMQCGRFCSLRTSTRRWVCRIRPDDRTTVWVPLGPTRRWTSDGDDGYSRGASGDDPTGQGLLMPQVDVRDVIALHSFPSPLIASTVPRVVEMVTTLHGDALVATLAGGAPMTTAYHRGTPPPARRR
jgi:hypothetical protein